MLLTSVDEFARVRRFPLQPPGVQVPDRSCDGTRTKPLPGT